MSKKINNMKIKTRLLAAFLSVLAIGIALGITGLVSINTLSKMSDELYALQLETNDVIYVLDAHQKWRQEITVSVLNEKEFAGSLDSRTCMLGKWLDKGEADDAVIISLLQDISVPHEMMHEEAAALSDLIDAGRFTEAKTKLTGSILPKTDSVIAGLSQIQQRYLEMIDDKTYEIVKAGDFLTALIIIILGIAILAGVLLSVLFPRTITRPILTLTSSMIEAADGDFTISLPKEYGAEMGQLFEACDSLIGFCNMSVSSLKKTITDMRGLAQNLLSISSHMAESSGNLKGQTSSVSTATEEFSAGMAQSANSLSTASLHISAVAASIEEINSTISAVAAAAEQTSTMVVQSSSLVDNIQASISKASGSVTAVSDSFNSVAESVEEINKSISTVSKHSVDARNKMSEADEKAQNTNMIIQRLEAASKQIGKIVNLISDIADQTNMLALNAAIEAAGAGEAGKSFMIVANEVKELAKQTAEATEEIAEQIENMQRNMPEAVGAVSEITTIINGMAEFMNSFSIEITEQGKRSDQISFESAAAAKRMNEISGEINSISENALSVTRTVADSTTGVNEIAKSTAELVVGSQEIAMNAERASNNISEINRSTNEMTGGVVDISKNIQYINKEAGEFQESADSTKTSSEELLVVANDLEEFISRFKVK